MPAATGDGVAAVAGPAAGAKLNNLPTGNWIRAEKLKSRQPNASQASGLERLGINLNMASFLVAAIRGQSCERESRGPHVEWCNKRALRNGVRPDRPGYRDGATFDRCPAGTH